MLLPVCAGGVARAEEVAARPVFLELFTAETCLFCPAAERNFNDIIASPNVIGITCMVDYFDAATPGVLARPFCRDRQAGYVRTLNAGAVYTPQLVINGAAQMPGQSLQAVSTALRGAREAGVLPLGLSIRAGTQAGVYGVDLPAMTGTGFVLRVTQVKGVADLSVLSGAAVERERSPHNIAIASSADTAWDGKAMTWTIALNKDESADAFIATVQERESGKVVAVGQYQWPSQKSEEEFVAPDE